MAKITDPEVEAYFLEKYAKSKARIVPGHHANFKSKEDVDFFFRLIESMTEEARKDAAGGGNPNDRNKPEVHDEAEDLGNREIRDGEVSSVTILFDSLVDLSRTRVLDNKKLKWHEDDCGRYLTLKEMYQQIKAKGYEGIIYVWEETPLHGTIYMCGNYEKGQWIKHGTTRGYA